LHSFVPCSFSSESELAYIDFLRGRNVPIEQEQIDGVGHDSGEAELEADISLVEEELSQQGAQPQLQAQLQTQRQAPGRDVRAGILRCTTLRRMRLQACIDRTLLEGGSRAFMAFLRAYKENQCSFIFRTDALDVASVAYAYGLLRLPRIPETAALLRQGREERHKRREQDQNDELEPKQGRKERRQDEEEVEEDEEDEEEEEEEEDDGAAITEVARGTGLSLLGKDSQIGFAPFPIETSTIRYRHKEKEAARQRRLVEALEQRQQQRQLQQEQQEQQEQQCSAKEDRGDGTVQGGGTRRGSAAEGDHGGGSSSSSSGVRKRKKKQSTRQKLTAEWDDLADEEALYRKYVFFASLTSLPPLLTFVLS
jgi:ATP-dependent RNA helicase DDX55/SPB4